MPEKPDWMHMATGQGPIILVQDLRAIVRIEAALAQTARGGAGRAFVPPAPPVNPRSCDCP
jgi:hypothetical protein